MEDDSIISIWETTVSIWDMLSLWRGPAVGAKPLERLELLPLGGGGAGSAVLQLLPLYNKGCAVLVRELDAIEVAALGAVLDGALVPRARARLKPPDTSSSTFSDPRFLSE
jgi:hypothetical protein